MLWLVYSIVAIIGFVFVYFNVLTGPKEIRQNGTTVLKYLNPPSVVEFYLRLLLNSGNLTKPGFLPKNKTIPPFEVIVAKADSKERLPQFEKITGFARDSKEIPVSFPYALSLSIFAGVLSHSTYPLKPMAGIIHMKQTILQLRPILKNESISKRGIFTAGKNTERGTEIDAITEVYQNNSVEESNLIGLGVSSFLILKKRGAQQEDSLNDRLPVTRTANFSVRENTGRQYAAGSGDYNPWHMYNFLAKLFGFRRAIAQGFWSLSKSLAEMQDHLPKYPIKMEVEWRKPIFMPSKVKLTERMSEDRNTIQFELHSEDGQHLHLIAEIQHVPDLTKTLKKN